jgi:site-specific recombinase XerD
LTDAEAITYFFVEGKMTKSFPGDSSNSDLTKKSNSITPYPADTLQRLWKEACKAVKVGIELYQATRHSVASMAASSGVSIAIIKEVLGHTDIRTTQKYSHVDVISQSQVFAAQERNKVPLKRKRDRVK